MKILVTGGNGFLGSWIVRALVEKGHSVRCLHRPKSDMSALKDIPVESNLGDVTDESSLQKACQGINTVFHVAGLISYSPADFCQMEKVNVEGTRNVAKACLQAGVERLVHTSSVVAIGASKRPKFLNEETPYEMGPYAFGYYDTKYSAELVIKEAVKNQKLDAVIVNPSIMFGAGDAVKGSRKTHMKVAAGRFPFYPSGGVNIMHVADAVDGHIRAWEKGRTGERYILGGDNILIKDLFVMLAEAGGHSPPAIPLPPILLRAAFHGARAVTALGLNRFSKFNSTNQAASAQTDSAMIATLFHWYDTAKARKELDLRCRPGYEALKESVKWARENGYIKD